MYVALLLILGPILTKADVALIEVEREGLGTSYCAPP